MIWKLRLLWYRSDKAALAFAAYFSAIVGALVFALMAVFEHWDAKAAQLREQRDAEADRASEFDARSLDCLARNVYYEARGESLIGQYAVAEVTMNRLASPLYPKTVCEVVYQRRAFSWTGMGDLGSPMGPAWDRAVRVAQDVYYERRPGIMWGLTHFHATYVQPDWSNERQQVARIGKHIFYR